MLYVESLRDGLHEVFASNVEVVLLGEDVLDPYGGAFKVSRGLSEKFPNQVYATPISESAIVGLCTGLALRGFRPIGEIMFGDFLALCADQIVNSAAKFPLMYGDNAQVPWVLRTPMGGARGYGPTHSQSLEKLFFGVPGLDVVAPSRLHEPGALLKSTILTCSRPTLFIEDKGDYPQPLINGENGSLFVMDSPEPGSSSTRLALNYDPSAHSPDVQVIAYGGAASMAADVLSKLKEEEIYGMLHAVAQLNDPLTLQALVESLDPEVPLLIVEQGAEGFGWASELISRRMTALPRLTCPPLMTLAARSAAIPAAAHLEKDVIVTPEKIEAKVLEMLAKWS